MGKVCENGIQGTHGARVFEFNQSLKAAGMEKTESKATQRKKGKEFTKRLPPVEVHNVRGAKRLLSRLITQLQNDEVEDRKAKSICYLLQVYVTIHKETETEERIAELERKLSDYGITARNAA